ncbi:hypothetical protein CLV42_11517 [Chitinophaga ginsengisoli]|uniref:Uncharacterized protein n=1 Tax=Chitinophaga ginsengisoli TaxID=363837 RepID=A0A2P8FRS7_9BACT|nr:hypothetical protein CLV42_11517 [Chitinophaga ginsengisoli]
MSCTMNMPVIVLGVANMGRPTPKRINVKASGKNKNFAILARLAPTDRGEQVYQPF